MTDSTATPAQDAKELAPSELRPSSPPPPRIPYFRRDILPANVVLSAADLTDFCKLIAGANDRAKKLELDAASPKQREDLAQAEQNIDSLMPLEYRYVAQNGDSVQGLGVPASQDHGFPDELRSLFVSNASFADREIKLRPLNVVEAFLSFEKPPLKLDLLTLPSNPTENRSVINVSGRDEDWVISTAERITDFLNRKRAFRPAVHGSGTYDYFVYLLYLPAIIWLYYKSQSSIFSEWIGEQPVFFNVILALYILLLSLLLARFLFQYARWLFPPMEYYKSSRVGAYVHRTIAGTIISAILLAAAYDVVRAISGAIFF